MARKSGITMQVVQEVSFVVAQQEKQQRPDEVVMVKLAPRLKKTVTWGPDVVDSESCKHCAKCAKRKAKKGRRSSPTRPVGYVTCEIKWVTRWWGNSTEQAFRGVKVYLANNSPEAGCPEQVKLHIGKSFARGNGGTIHIHHIFL